MFLFFVHGGGIMKTVKAISNGYNSEGRAGVPYYFKPAIKKNIKGEDRPLDFTHYEKKAMLSYKK